MNRTARIVVATVVALGVALAPTAAGATDRNVVVALNGTDGAAVAKARVEYRVAKNGVVDQENRAYAGARCTGCQTLAAAFQIVIVTQDPTTLAPINDAQAVNYECVQCVTWASAKQIVVQTGGPAEMTRSGRNRMKALEQSLTGLQAQMPSMSLEQLVAAVDAAFQELVDIALTEIRRTDGGHDDARIAATRSA
jgi:putative peptide zinc metalloprotease protein